ncbi:DUF5719 family protein [Ilumatobacter sp.]|uniref:DUF5719 family protein n=1 Tax=Ilumatobacter sp. TaxID=1967498 RepID=UPI003B522B59
MTRRAIPAIALLVVGLGGILAVGREAPVRSAPLFATADGTWMPAVGVSGALSGSWFCPGVPTDDADGVGGEIVVSNGGAEELIASYAVLTDAGVVTEGELSVAARSQARLDVDESADGASFSSVVVEVEGGRGFVEQIARHPLGTSVAACSNDTSPDWYIADGYTLDDSVETLVLTNPFDEPVSADLRFSTESRQAEPGQFDGFIVLPRSVRTIRIADLGARDEPVISVAIEARSGRLVVGRAQEYRGDRVGYDVSLAAPALRDQWWFADGERADGITETFSVYNPTDEEVEVTVFFGGLPLSATGVNERDPIVVPPRRVVVYDPTVVTGEAGTSGDADPPGTEAPDATAPDGSAPADGEGTDDEEGADDDAFVEFDDPSLELPVGRHATVFSTLAQPSIVVERVLTRPSGDSISTTVVQGATVRPPNGFVASAWRVGVGPTEPTEDALVVWNIDQVPSTVSVSVIGPDGASVVPSLSEIPLAEGAIATIDLVDPELLGRELVVSATTQVFVERSLPRGGDLAGRSGSWPLPQAG